MRVGGVTRGGSRPRTTCPSGQVAAALALVALAPASASAAPSNSGWITPLGSEAAMSGGAVNAIGRDTGSAWYNPAGLGANTRAQFDMTGTLATLRYRIIPGAFRVELPGGSASAGLTSIQPLVRSTSTVYTRYMGRGVTLGAAHFVSSYDFYDYSGGLVDLEAKKGAAYDTHVQVDGSATRRHLGPTVGWQIRPRIRVGMSLFFTYESQRDEGRILARIGPDADTLDDNYLIGDVDLKRTTYAAEAVLGLQWEFVRRFHLGLAVRTPRLVVVERVRRYEVVSRGVKLADGHYAVDVDAKQGDDVGAARRGRTAPININLGLAYELPRDLGWVSVEGDYSPALRHVSNEVDLRRTINGRVGARVRAGENIHVGLGFFTDRANQTTITTFPQFNISYYGGTMGVEYRRLIRLGAHERAREIQFRTTLAVRYAYGAGASGNVTFDAHKGIDAPIHAGYGVVDKVAFHNWGGHLGAGLYF